MKIPTSKPRKERNRSRRAIKVDGGTTVFFIPETSPLSFLPGGHLIPNQRFIWSAVELPRYVCHVIRNVVYCGHFPESKTLPRIQKQFPEFKPRPKNQEHSQESKILPRIQNVFWFWVVFWILGSVFEFWDVFWIRGSVFRFWEVFWILGRVFEFLGCVLSLSATVVMYLSPLLSLHSLLSFRFSPFL